MKRAGRGVTYTAIRSVRRMVHRATTETQPALPEPRAVFRAGKAPIALECAKICAVTGSSRRKISPKLLCHPASAGSAIPPSGHQLRCET